MEDKKQSTVNSDQSTVDQTSLSTVHRSPNSFLVILLSILLIISCLIAGFFAYQTQRLVKQLSGSRNQNLVTPIPTTTPDPTADWKTYTDDKLNISFNYPQNLTFKIMENGVVKFIDQQNEFVFNFNGIQYFTELEFTNYKFIDPKELTDQMGRKWKTYLVYAEVYNYEAFFDNSNKIIQVAFQGKTKGIESLANQILSTFKFIEAVASTFPLPVACTMDAKICPDGTSVGRSGPNCEFPSCPKPQQ